MIEYLVIINYNIVFLFINIFVEDKCDNLCVYVIVLNRIFV